MKKIVLVILAFVISAIAGCCVRGDAPPRYDSRPNIVDALKSKTVALVVKDELGDVSSYCSGVWVDYDKIVTADHCARATIESTLGLDADDPDQRPFVQAVEKGIEIVYITEEDSAGAWQEPRRVHLAEVDRFDYDHDLALLIIRDLASIPIHGIASLAVQTPAQGEELHVMGHPSGLTWTYGHGYVAAYRMEGFKPAGKIGPFLQAFAPAWHGNSGGGAFNNEGELIGIAVFLTRTPLNLMYVHLDTIRSFLAAR